MTFDGARGLVLAGQAVPDAWDRVRRYCGCAWSGGPAEVWAFHYYDAIPSSGQRVEPLDVLAAGVLHPGVGRDALAFFHDAAPALEAWVTALPTGTDLPDAGDVVVDHLGTLRDWPDAPALSLLTKVLHRVRPRLIPLLDREILDWYRPLTGERGASAAWPHLVRATAADVSANCETLSRMADDLLTETGVRVSALRILDIAIWMGGPR